MWNDVKNVHFIKLIDANFSKMELLYHTRPYKAIFAGDIFPYIAIDVCDLKISHQNFPKMDLRCKKTMWNFFHHMFHIYVSNSTWE